MATVTEIRRQPGCVRISLSTGETLRVPTPLFRLFPLRAGDEVDPGAWQDAWREQAYSFALERAAALLSARDMSEQAVAQRLRQSGYPEQTVARVMQALTRAGYLDDTRYAGHYVESRSHRYGARRLYTDLRQKGVSEAVARDALESLSDGDEEASARRLAEKLLARRDVSDPDVRRKAVQQLVRRGFSWDVARDAVADAGGPESDDDDV